MLHHLRWSIYIIVSVGVDENMAQEWKIYSLPMDEEFLGTIKYDASLPLFVEGIVFSLIVCPLKII